jgi:small subunit ribosomal protein S21
MDGKDGRNLRSFKNFVSFIQSAANALIIVINQSLNQLIQQTSSKFQKHSLHLPSLKGGISGIMIIINVKDGESLDKALKRFKKKFEKTGVLRELRSRQAFEKKSVTRRHVVKHAIYKQNMNLETTV